MTLNSSFKGVVFSYMTPILYENLINRKNFTLRICRETMHSTLLAFYFTKNFYLVNEINEVLSNFQSAGLIGYVMSKYVSMNSMNKVEKQPPSALTYDNMEGFFELLYYGFSISFVCFIFEIIFGFINRRTS